MPISTGNTAWSAVSRGWKRRRCQENGTDPTLRELPLAVAREPDGTSLESCFLSACIHVTRESKGVYSTYTTFHAYCG